jgi:hypothetical protein
MRYEHLALLFFSLFRVQGYDLNGGNIIKYEDHPYLYVYANDLGTTFMVHRVLVDGNERTVKMIRADADNALKGDGTADWYWPQGCTYIFAERNEELTERDTIRIEFLVLKKHDE